MNIQTVFTSLEQAEAFKKNNYQYLCDLENEALAIEGVVRTEVWINKNCPSFVLGISSEDQDLVSIRI